MATMVKCPAASKEKCPEWCDHFGEHEKRDDCSMECNHNPNAPNCVEVEGGDEGGN